tara:strand:- start:1058 stop:1360 length:303 start_codon:yes stop_codon:yes gene_type:complete
MIWKLDDNNNEYTTAAGAARYIGLPRTTFLHYLSDKCPLPENLRPKFKIYLFKQIFYKSDLDEWKNKTSKIKFSYKIKRQNTNLKVSNVSKFPIQSKQSK